MPFEDTRPSFFSPDKDELQWALDTTNLSAHTPESHDQPFVTFPDEPFDSPLPSYGWPMQHRQYELPVLPDIISAPAVDAEVPADWLNFYTTSAECVGVEKQCKEQQHPSEEKDSMTATPNTLEAIDATHAQYSPFGPPLQQFGWPRERMYANKTFTEQHEAVDSSHNLLDSPLESYGWPAQHEVYELPVQLPEIFSAPDVDIEVPDDWLNFYPASTDKAQLNAPNEMDFITTTPNTLDVIDSAYTLDAPFCSTLPPFGWPMYRMRHVQSPECQQSPTAEGSSAAANVMQNEIALLIAERITALLATVHHTGDKHATHIDDGAEVVDQQTTVPKWKNVARRPMKPCRPFNNYVAGRRHGIQQPRSHY